MLFTNTDTSSGVIVALSFKSAPAQNTFSTSDLTMTTRAGLSYVLSTTIAASQVNSLYKAHSLALSSSFKDAENSFKKALLTAFLASGRFKFKMAIPFKIAVVR